MTSISKNVSQWVQHPSRAKQGVHHFPGKLYVCTMLENPIRWRARYSNYWLFHDHVENSGGEVYTAEVAFGDREFEITEPGNPQQLQLRTRDELWHKENALNLLIQRLPADAEYVAWVDADIRFVRPDWVQETMHLLQHYDFIQMFSTAQDLNYDNEPAKLHYGLMKCYMDGVPSSHGNPLLNSYSGDAKGVYWHPGFAWAARVDALDKVGGLIDWAILGSGDWHMAWGLLGRMGEHLHAGLSQSYKDWCFEWERRAEQHVRRNVGYMPGTVLHYFHGTKENRHYGDRWSFLSDAHFDPVVDIKRDHRGLWQLNPHNAVLRDGIRTYNRIRCEDDRY